MSHDLGPLPRIHPRETKCHEAEIELSEAISTWRKKWGDELTATESASILYHELSSRMRSMFKYAIRRERHGDTDKPGGLE
jgi:hypothetical protein